MTSQVERVLLQQEVHKLPPRHFRSAHSWKLFVVESFKCHGKRFLFHCAEGALHLGNGLISSWWAIDCFSLSDQTSINAIDQQSQTAETVLRQH